MSSVYSTSAATTSALSFSHQRAAKHQRHIWIRSLPIFLANPLAFDSFRAWLSQPEGEELSDDRAGRNNNERNRSSRQDALELSLAINSSQDSINRGDPRSRQIALAIDRRFTRFLPLYIPTYIY